MAYIGLQPQQKTVATSTQQLSGTGVAFEFTLNRAVSKAADILVFVGASVQVPEYHYVAYDNKLLFTAGNAPPLGVNNISVNYKAGALTSINLTANSFPIGTTTSPAIRSIDSTTTGIYWPSTTSLGFTTLGNTRLTVSDSATATSTSTGAVRVAGGVGIVGALYVGGDTRLVDTTQSTSTADGALVVSGGVGVAKNMFVGGSISVAGDFTVAGTFTTTGADSLSVTDPFIFLANANLGDSLDSGFVSTYNDGAQRYTGLFRDITDGKYKLFNNLTEQPTTTVNTAATSYSYADLTVGNITATNVYGIIAGSQDITTVGNLVNVSVVGTVKSYDVNYIYSTITSTSTASGALQVSGGVGVAGNINAGGTTNKITGTTIATNTTSGVLQVSGGVGVAGNLYAGNVGGTYLTGSLITASQTAITAVGTLGALTVTGNVSTGNTIGTYLTGTLTTAAQPAITSVGTLGSLTVTGNISSGNTIGTYLTGTLTTATQSAITTVGTLGSLTVTGNVSTGNTIGTYLTGTLTTAAQSAITSVGTLSALTTSGAIVSGGKITPSANVTLDLGSTTNYWNNLYAATYYGTTGSFTGSVTVSGGISGTLSTAAQTNITSVGTLSALTVSGAITVNSGNNVTAIINGGTTGVGNIGSTTKGFNTIFAKSTSAQYADLAENYLADLAYEPGTVVHFGGEQEVTLCDTDMCSRVAGVVSTAPAHLMNTGLVGEHVVALALTGRVPTKVQGTVRKGDMMVSAGNGLARAESNPRVGSVIGKALENFDGPEGVIEVVIGKH